MIKQITGLSSLTNNQNPVQPSTGMFSARVRFSMVNDKEQPQAFKDFGEWGSIGGIFFDRLNNPNPNPLFSTDNFAKPLFPQSSNIPLKNELVYIMAMPNSNIQSDVNAVIYYYFQSINVWNSTHHNAIPDPILNPTTPESQTQDYQQTSVGDVRRVTDGGTEIDLGKGFKEKLNIRNLQPFPGDIFHQGRWGQSLRFSSTLENSEIPSPWSSVGEDGDPITILRNGQHEEDKDPWIPQVEDINTDPSSIYLTSTQSLPIEVSSKNYKSYSSAPKSPNTFTGEQIILNSGRLLFNSKTDSILLSSADTINLNAVNSLNIDAPKSVLNSREIYLGDKNANESVILGDKFLSDLQKLLLSLISLSAALATPIGTPGPSAPNAAIPGPATDTQVKATNMLNKIEQYKSKVSKTK